MILTVALALFASVRAEDWDENVENDPRLGYITVGSNGATTLTFNATSIQNAVILGLFILVLGALVLPLFGVSMGEYFEDTGYGYGYEQPAYGYEEPSTGYNTYAKRQVTNVATPSFFITVKATPPIQDLPLKLLRNDGGATGMLPLPHLTSPPYLLPRQSHSPRDWHRVAG